MRRTLDSMLLGRVLVAFVAVMAGLVVSISASRAEASTEILIDLNGTGLPGPVGPTVLDPTDATDAANAANPLYFTTQTTSADDPNSYAWNNLTSPDAWNASSVTPKISNLLSTSGATTGVSAYVTDNFNPFYSNLSGGITGTGLYPDNATYDYWWVYTDNANLSDGAINAQGTIELTGLSPLLPVNIQFYGAAARTDSTPRKGTYTAVGANTVSVSNYDAYNNSTTVGLLTGIIPDSNGHIFFTVTPGVDGVSAFINVLDITITPEPASCSLLMVGMAGAMLRRRRA